MSKWLWVIFTLSVSVIYLLLFRELSKRGIDGWWLLIPIGILALLSFYGYYVLFSMGDIGVMYGIITGSLVLMMALAGVLFYHEHLTTFSWIGLILIVIGVVLLSLPW